VRAKKAFLSGHPAPPDPRDSRLGPAPHKAAGDVSKEPHRLDRRSRGCCRHGAVWKECSACEIPIVRVGVGKATAVSVHGVAVARTRVRAALAQWQALCCRYNSGEGVYFTSIRMCRTALCMQL